MKTRKQYVQPAITQVNVKLQTMIAGSEIGVGSGRMNASKSLSRRGSNWDDDEDE